MLVEQKKVGATNDNNHAGDMCSCPQLQPLRRKPVQTSKVTATCLQQLLRIAWPRQCGTIASTCIFKLPVHETGHSHTHTRGHTHTRTHAHTRTHTHLHTHMRALACALARTCTHTHLHTHAHARTRTHTHTQQPTRTHIQAHACTHMHTH